MCTSLVHRPFSVDLPCLTVDGAGHSGLNSYLGWGLLPLPRNSWHLGGLRERCELLAECETRVRLFRILNQNKLDAMTLGGPEPMC